MALIIPKNNADAQTLDATLRIYYEANDWVQNSVLIDKLSSALDDLGIEEEKKEPQSYTKKTQVLAYFGFITWQDVTNSQSPRRITELGKRFYEARLAEDTDTAITVLIESLNTCTFGRNVIGCDSDSDIEAPNVFIKASLLLKGLSNNEFAFILGRMEFHGEEFHDAVLKVKVNRIKKIKTYPEENAKKWNDPKPITALKNWGFFNSDDNTISDKVFLKYADKLLLLRTKNTESVKFKSDFGFDDLSQEISEQFRSFITAIKSKPFLLLAGISGTGKSRIVRELARACWDEGSEEYKAQKPKNFEMVQVKPNWHDSSELIGYVSRIDGVRYVVGPFLKFMVKAIQDPDTPYFLCLDEMNLAPVEQYFAEYLSVVESRKRQDDGTIVTDPIVDYSNTEEYKSLIDQLFPDDDELRKEYLTEEGGKRLSIPQNLIVIGTVNMDETTFSFSRKVLDRAMTIEMNEVDLKGGLAERYEPIGKLGAAELIGKAVEGVDVYETNKDVCDIAIDYLQKINEKLEGTPFKIAYRTRNEFLLYVVNNLPYNKDDVGKDIPQQDVINRALDEITSMKILSRIEGDSDKIGSLLDDLKKVVEEQLGEQYDKGKSVSLKKLQEMKNRLSSGYTSFWS